MNTKKLRANILLFLTAMIWGSSFVAQDSAMDAGLGPFTFGSVRFMIGAVVLIPVIVISWKLNPPVPDKKREVIKNSIKGGVCCGLVLFVSASLQQVGMAWGTDSGKAGFITALYIVIVPVLGLFMRKKVPLNAWIAVAVASVGFYFLCLRAGSFTMQKGDVLIALCALCFSVHIIVIDHFSPNANGVLMSCIQFAVTSVLSAPLMIFSEGQPVSMLFSSALPIIYSGIMSCGVAYTLQIVAQRDTEPTIASLIMSLESVFAAISGAIILGQLLSTREMLGCILIFGAVILAQLQFKRKVGETR